MIPPDSQKIYLVGLHRAMNLTFVRWQKLKAFFGNDWKKCFQARISEWQAAGMDKVGIEKFFSARAKLDLELEMKKLHDCDAEILYIEDKNYPIQLKNIYAPPVLLFFRGKFSHSDFPSVAVVGSRKVSTYGQRVVADIVGDIAAAGVTITSGLAFGVDTLAHETALARGAQTIAVLGNGIDTIYPRKNSAFAEKILAENRGVIFSEYLPGTPIRPENFPVRNRIVAGLTRATIVVEASAKSGSLITAELALDQGKDVFAVPGDIFSPTSAGTNKILSQGAYPALSGAQILEHLGFKKSDTKKKSAENLSLSENERVVLESFSSNTETHINDIVRAVELPAAGVNATLAMLEIKGLVKHLGTQKYVSMI